MSDDEGDKPNDPETPMSPVEDLKTFRAIRGGGEPYLTGSDELAPWDDLSDKQIRNDAITSAAMCFQNVPYQVPAEQVVTMAKRFEKYINEGE